ncbi:MAG: hypothetical protein ACRDTZ_01900 [Pseudonocardiaceae bacterium]
MDLVRAPGTRSSPDRGRTGRWTGGQVLASSPTYTYELVDHVAGERMVMRTADNPFPMETTYTGQSVPGEP